MKHVLLGYNGERKTEFLVAFSPKFSSFLAWQNDFMQYSSLDNGGSLSGQSLFNYIRVEKVTLNGFKINLKCLGFLAKQK